VLRDDWVMRMVKQLAAAIARIAGLRQAGLLDEAALALDEAFVQLGVDPRLAGTAEPATLLAVTTDPALRAARAARHPS
jgi:hypothetical protein